MNGRERAEIEYISVERIHPHPDNPRKELGDLTELAGSIEGSGVLQNLTVVPSYQVAEVMDALANDPNVADDEQYVAIIGHRRLAAAKLAGLTEVPCVVASMTAKEQVQTMLMENMQRADLTVYEQARGFQMMLDLGATVEEIAESSRFSETTIRRRLKMAELDQTTLKEVSETRQLSLGDFDKLAQIEDLAERNKVLKDIGTNDFNRALAGAISAQKTKQNLPLVKAWLKEAGAEKISRNETWSNKYESYPGCSAYIYIDRWGEDNNKPPKKTGEKIFYFLDGNWLRLYRKRKEAKAERKPPEALEKERRIREAWETLDRASATAYELRRQFIGELTPNAKNRTELLRGALAAALLETVDYNSPDRDALNELLGLKPGYDENRAEKLAKALSQLREADELLPKIVYALFGDHKKACCAQNSRNEFPKYALNTRLNLLYDWLTRLGYEMSTEEMALLNGEHAGYKAGGV